MTPAWFVARWLFTTAWLLALALWWHRAGTVWTRTAPAVAIVCGAMALRETRRRRPL